MKLSMAIGMVLFLLFGCATNRNAIVSESKEQGSVTFSWAWSDTFILNGTAVQNFDYFHNKDLLDHNTSIVAYDIKSNLGEDGKYLIQFDPFSGTLHQTHRQGESISNEDLTYLAYDINVDFLVDKNGTFLEERDRARLAEEIDKKIRRVLQENDVQLQISVTPEIVEKCVGFTQNKWSETVNEWNNKTFTIGKEYKWSAKPIRFGSNDIPITRILRVNKTSIEDVYQITITDRNTEIVRNSQPLRGLAQFSYLKEWQLVTSSKLYPYLIRSKATIVFNQEDKYVQSYDVAYRNSYSHN